MIRVTHCAGCDPREARGQVRGSGAGRRKAPGGRFRARPVFAALLACLAAALMTGAPGVAGSAPPSASPHPATPATLSPPLEYQNLRITTPDSVYLAAWYVPARDSAGAVRARLGPAVLIVPREDDTMADRLPMIAALARRGFGVFTFDHRGTGGSGAFRPEPGALVEPEYLVDVHSALDILLTRAGVDSSRIAVYGASRGAWLALALVGERPQPRAVVAVSPPFNGKEWVNVLDRYDPGRKHVIPKDWKRSHDPDEVTDRYNDAILFIAGDADLSTPAWMAEDLYRKYPRPKDLWIVEGAAHSGDRTPERVAGPAYYGRIAAFLERELARPPHRGWPRR